MTSANASANVQWSILRNQSSFITKQREGGNVIFTSEPFNLTQRNTFSASGLVNGKALSIAAGEKNALNVTLKRFKGKNHRSPKNSTRTVAINGKRGSRAIIKSVKNLMRNYRADLTCPAAARVVRLNATANRKAELPARKTRKWAGSK